MSLLVVGSVGIDTVETPTDKRVDVPGGSGVFFAYSAGYYTRVWMIGSAGADYPDDHRSLLTERDIDLEGLEIVPDGHTFRWHGKYHDDLIGRDTIDVQLNVLGSFNPKVPDSWTQPDYVFLANDSPRVQHEVLKQLTKRPRLVGCDTMDLWITTAREDLEALIKEVDILVLNDDEARSLTGKRELLNAGHAVMEMGPKRVVIKKGEHGLLTIGKNGCFALPSVPLEHIIDPTGAGDSFAGGMMGYLARKNAGADGEISDDDLRLALLQGTVAASFTVQDFSLDGLRKTTDEARSERLKLLREMTRLPAE